jgi:hypothetical protein
MNVFRYLILSLALASCLATGAAKAAEDHRLENTPLGQIAAKLAPGGFVEIKTVLPQGMTNLSELFYVRDDDGRQLAIDGWTDSAHWDPQRKRTFFIGMRKYKKFISYDVPTNTWHELGWDGDPPPKFEKFGHVYGRTALDWKRGHYYWLSPGNILNRYWIDEARWEAIPGVAIGGPISIEWHEKLDMLITITRGHKMVSFRNGELKSMGYSAVDGYHSVGCYNRKRGDMLFAGGNQSLRKIDLVDASGKLHSFKDAPIDISIKNASLTYDPQSGNYLIVLRTQRQIYEFNPDRDEWRLAREWTEAEWPFGPHGFFTPVVIDELGVLFWQSVKGNRVYRHRSVFN